MSIEHAHDANGPVPPIGGRFVRFWVLACVVGWPVGFVVGFVAAHLAEPLGETLLAALLGYGMLGFGLGAVVGFMQWLLLRRRIRRGGRWIWGSALGLAVTAGSGTAIANALGYSEELANFKVLAVWVLVIALGGLLAGLLQRIVLRHQVRHAGRWVLAATLGWALSTAVGGALMVMAPRGFVLLANLAVGGIVMGLVTGPIMAQLLRAPREAA